MNSNRTTRNNKRTERIRWLLMLLERHPFHPLLQCDLAFEVQTAYQTHQQTHQQVRQQSAKIVQMAWYRQPHPLLPGA